MQKDNRIEKIRVMAMFMVVLIHVANYYGRAFADISTFNYVISVIFNVLCRVSVPIFFMISGYFLLQKEYDPKKNKKRIINRLISLIIFTIIFCLWDHFFMGKNFNIFRLLNEPERKVLWFMYANIAIYICLPFIKILIDHLTIREEKLFVILWAFFNGIGDLFNIFNAYRIPLINGAYYLGYFIVGYFIFKYKDKIDKKFKRFYPLIYILSSIPIIVVTIIVSLNKNMFWNELLTYKNIFMIMLSTSFFLMMLNILNNNENKLITVISKCSYGVYLIHGIILDIIMKIVPYKTLPSLIFIPILGFVISVISIAIIYLLKKVKYVKDYI